MIFVHLSSLMAQGIPPEVETLPPAIKWYMRLLRKCAGKVVGNESQSTASLIKKLDIAFLFWPFVISFDEIEDRFALSNQIPFRKMSIWSSRYYSEIKRWRDKLIDLLCNDLSVTIASSLQVDGEPSCYSWLPFAEYALSPDHWTWLHDLLSHSKGSVEEIESRHKTFLETSTTDASTLGMATVLVEILAQEFRTCNHCHVSKNLKQALPASNTRHQGNAAECCGCLQQDGKCTDNAAALLIWMIGQPSTELCDNTWFLIFNNLLLAASTSREGFAIQYYDSSDEPLSDRMNPPFSHKEQMPLQAIDSTIITLVQNEKKTLLSKCSGGADRLQNQAFKQAEKSKWRLESVVWPALLSHISCCSYSFVYHRILEILETFGPQFPDFIDDMSKDNSSFPLLQLHMDQLLEVVKLEPRFILPLMMFLESGSKIEAISSLKPGKSEKSSSQDFKCAELNLCALQEDEYMAAIHHCVLQKSDSWKERFDVLYLRVAAFSCGSFRYLVGEWDSMVKTKSNMIQKSGVLSNARIFGKISTREAGVADTAGLVASIEGRRLLAWELRKWTEKVLGVSNAISKKCFPDHESLKRIYIWVSALHTKFLYVDAWLNVRLSALGRALRVQEEDTLWEREVNDEAGKGARSAKRPRLNSYTTNLLPRNFLETEREDSEWIVEALCRSSVSLEKYLLIYLSLNDTKRGRPKKGVATGSKQKAPPETISSHRKILVSYLAKHPSQIPNLASLCQNKTVLQVACEGILESSTKPFSIGGSDIFEVWFQFLEKFRLAGGKPRSLVYLHGGSLLDRLTECVLHGTTLLCNLPQDLLENLVSVSPGMIRRIYEEARQHLQSRPDAQFTGFQDTDDFCLRGVVTATDLKPQAMAECLESTMLDMFSSVGTASRSSHSRSSLLDLLSMVFASCRPESRNIVLSHLQESNLYKKSIVEDFDAITSKALAPGANEMAAELAPNEWVRRHQRMLLGPAFVLGVVFWCSKVLTVLKNIYEHRDLDSINHNVDGVRMDLNVSFSDQRAAICHILVTCEPNPCSNIPEDDQNAQTCVQKSSTSCEEMIFQLQAFAPSERNPSLYHSIISWLLQCCKMNIRLNLEHIRAICRLHPLMMRDGLIKRIDTELMEASKVEGKELVWKSSLEALRRGILDGLLAWLPLDARSNLTTTFDDVPSDFFLGSNSTSVEEIISCLRSTNIGVRRSAYYFVVAHQHHHHFVSSLALELCKRVVHAEPTKEQEAFLGVLMPVLMNESHTASMSVDAVVMLFRKAKALILNLNAGGESESAALSSEPKLKHVEALLRVALLACEVSPHNFATEEVALLLFTLAKAESSEEIVVGAMQCLIALALDLKVTIKHMKLLKDLLLHLAYKPAGDYVWHLAIAFAERFATGALKARFSLKDETNPGIHEEKLSLEFSFAVRELPRGCPLQRFIPLQAILKRFDCMGYRHT
nr:uncharacterized protein LOC112277514 isoform X2 [Physcomitrium patens]|eukprot:XP_024365719.1 uncharacterized protein LOC112277514 isoform X2 [Physcomitrella patens]